MSQKSIKKNSQTHNFCKKKKKKKNASLIVVDISFKIFLKNIFKMTGHFRMTQIQGFILFIMLHYGQLFSL